MKCKLSPLPYLLLALMLLSAAGLGLHAQNTEVSFAAFTLPEQSTGLLHWRSSAGNTKPIQLSTRYFSEPQKMESNMIEFYQNALLVSESIEKPEPLLRITIPQGVQHAYVVIYYDSKDGKWETNTLDAKDWRTSTMRVYNAFGQTLVIEANKKPLQVKHGQYYDFKADDSTEKGFAVKIFQTVPDNEAIFSSKWRVTANRRELLFIGNSDGSIKLRSLMELDSR